MKTRASSETKWLISCGVQHCEPRVRHKEFVLATSRGCWHEWPPARESIAASPKLLCVLRAASRSYSRAPAVGSWPEHRCGARPDAVPDLLMFDSRKHRARHSARARRRASAVARRCETNPTEPRATLVAGLKTRPVSFDARSCYTCGLLQLPAKALPPKYPRCASIAAKRAAL